MLVATQMYFPSVYDIKYLMKFCDNLHGGLNKLAECLDVNRIGPQHQVHHRRRRCTPPPSPSLFSRPGPYIARTSPELC